MASTSSGSSRSTESYNPAQQPYFQSLWEGGQNLMDRGEGVGQLQRQATQLYGQGQQMQGNLQNNPFLQGNLSEGGQQQLAGMNQNIETMGGRAMHQLGQTGVQAGAFGQSRGEVGRGVIGEGMMMASNDAYGQAMQGDLARGGIYAQSQLGGLNALQGQQQIGAAGAMAPYMPLQQQASFIGPSQQTTQQSGSDRSMSVLNK